MSDITAAIAEGRRPLHDPASCDRMGCGRCRPQGKPRSPKLVDHQVAKPSKPRTRVVDLVSLMGKVGPFMAKYGDETSERFIAWYDEGTIDGDDGSDDELDEAMREGKADRDREAAMLAAQAARYSAEWSTLLARLDADLRRVRRLIEIAHPPRPNAVAPKNRTAAQVEADGWCGSCWKSAGQLTPIAERPSGEPYYRGRCRWCGGWPGGDPPQDAVRAHLSGKTVRRSA